MIARLQFWLQGHPNRHRPWCVVWLGNLLADLRFWMWSLYGAAKKGAK